MSLEKSRSSPKRLLLKLSPRRNSKSEPTTPNHSPKRKSSLSQIHSPRDLFSCWWCKKSLKQEGDKILCIKCDCNPSAYFCSKICHRSHWIDPSSGRCSHLKFENFDSELSWDQTEYVFNKFELEKTIYFPITVDCLSKSIRELGIFKKDMDINELMTVIANFNFSQNIKITILPLSKNRFELKFLDKEYINFGEYNRILQLFKNYFLKNGAKLLTNKIILEQKK